MGEKREWGPVSRCSYIGSHHQENGVESGKGVDGVKEGARNLVSGKKDSVWPPQGRFWWENLGEKGGERRSRRRSRNPLNTATLNLHNFLRGRGERN